MKVRVLAVLIIVILTFLLVSCKQNDDSTTPNNINNINNAQGEDHITEIKLMTKEEFIKYIEENQHLETVNITLDDLKCIDIDDFIAYCQFTKEDIDGFYLKYALELYLENLKYMKLERHMSSEIISVSSSAEEFEAFIEEYFKKVNRPYKNTSKDRYGIDNFDISIDGKEYRIRVGRTQNLGDYETEKNNNGFYCIMDFHDEVEA